MKTNFTKFATALAVSVAFLNPLSVNPLSAQEEGSGNSGGGGGGLVTVLDVAAVFDKNPSFNGLMDAIKAEADRLKTDITAKQEQIRQNALQLQDLTVGSADRNKKEAELEQQQTSLRTDARQSEQDLLNREALIYYETYRTLQNVVAEIAEEYNISLVLRYDSTEIDKTNRAEVIKGVNRTVVFHRQLDLTKLVSERMNARTANAGSTSIR